MSFHKHTLAKSKTKGKPGIPTLTKCLLGSTSAVIAGLFVHPFEVIKVRMQISGIGQRQREYLTTMHCIKSIVAQEGIKKMGVGLGISMWRQAIYTTARLGIYSQMVDMYKMRLHRKPTLATRISFGILSSALAAFVSNPAELLFIRIVSDAKRPLEERQNYKNSYDALKRLYRAEGLRVFLRGSIANVERAALINFVQLYGQVKFAMWLRREPFNIKDSFLLYVLSSTCSGLMAAVISAPLDIAKTRIQNQIRTEPSHITHFFAIDALHVIAQSEGFSAWWKGIVPHTFRVIPHTVIAFSLLQYFTHSYERSRKNV